MSAALIRYRALAYVTGVALLVLVFGALPMDLAGHGSLAAVVGPIHGFLYIVYLVFAFDLARRCRWPLGWTIVVLLAGTIPFLTFVVERKVVHRLRETPTLA